jgi:chromosome partitioning protein
MTKVITVMNLKGGSAKTTTAAFLAHAYAKQGLKTLVVDADPQASILNWAATAGWDIPVIGQPVPKLHTMLGGIIGERYDVVVIDTPPLDEKAGIVYGALRAADTILIPLAPTMMEFGRLKDVWSAIDEVQGMRDDEIRAAVVLTRAVTNAASTNLFREQLEAEGHRVLTTAIPRREAIAQSFGAPITALFDHDQVAIELDKKEIHK